MGELNQTSDVGASTSGIGSAVPPCTDGKVGSSGVKGGHDIVVVTAAVLAGALAGYVAGTLGAKQVLKSVKGGQD